LKLATREAAEELGIWTPEWIPERRDSTVSFGIIWWVFEDACHVTPWWLSVILPFFDSWMNEWIEQVIRKNIILTCLLACSVAERIRREEHIKNFSRKLPPYFPNVLQMQRRFSSLGRIFWSLPPIASMGVLFSDLQLVSNPKMFKKFIQEILSFKKFE